MGRLLKYWRLPRARRRVLGEAWRKLALARLRLSSMRFRTVMARQERVRAALAEGNADPEHELEHVVWAITRARRAVPGATCLVQALAGQSMLAARGIPSEIQFGVAKPSGGRLEAHAWLECEGRTVLGEHEPRRFERLTGFRERTSGIQGRDR